jgi:deoxyribose-phosphate aldolase
MTDLAAVARRALPLVDLTSLDEDDDDAVAESLCARAQTPAGPVAAVCLMPALVPLAVERLAGTAVRVATVANFPDGAPDPSAAARQTADAVAAGADEVDVVAPWRAWLDGDRDAVRTLVAACREACAGRADLKVILEAGSLPAADAVQALAADALAAGADFVKTSTGKVGQGATLEAARAMLTAIRDAGGSAGFKAAGGIRTTAQAAEYLALADELLGRGWATPQTFRLGASGLLDDLLAQL